MGSPVTVFPRVTAHDQSRNVYLTRFEEPRQSVLVDDGLVGHAVIPDQWERQNEYLSPIGRVGERLGITHHAGVEYHLARTRGQCPEGSAGDVEGSIVEVEMGNLSLIKFVSFRFVSLIGSSIALRRGWQGEDEEFAIETERKRRHRTTRSEVRRIH